MSWITPWLAVSGNIHRQQVNGLAELGIGAIVDLRAEAKDDEALFAQHGIRFLYLPVRDHWSPSQAQLREGADWVLAHVGGGGKALVHCRSGIGRSAVLACCTLMRHGLDLPSALRLVRSRRWGVALNRRHREAVREFARSQQGKQATAD